MILMVSSLPYGIDTVESLRIGLNKTDLLLFKFFKQQAEAVIQHQTLREPNSPRSE